MEQVIWLNIFNARPVSIQCSSTKTFYDWHNLLSTPHYTNILLVICELWLKCTSLKVYLPIDIEVNNLLTLLSLHVCTKSHYHSRYIFIYFDYHYIGQGPWWKRSLTRLVLERFRDFETKFPKNNFTTEISNIVHQSSRISNSNFCWL